ncbi:MAG TPA: hypothetical protein VGD35_22025, partial [Chitinophaga sp.]
MKLLAVLLLILLYHPVCAQEPADNPNYDFPDSIVAKTGRGRGYINSNMDALSVSGHYWES